MDTDKTTWGKFQKNAFFFLLGGFLYCGIETLFRGYSHISMVIAGGLCFMLIGKLGMIKKEISLPFRMLLSVLIITSVELVTGIIVNLYMGLQVWDYSGQQYNFMGQICLAFCNIWFFLSLPAILFYDYINYWFMNGRKPSYHI